MTCDEVKSKLKPFMEDMLAEDEYRLFVAHIKSCFKCRDYVRSFGALSNQLWKLGDIEVPSDFVATVIFNLTHHKPAVSPATGPEISKKLAAGIIVSILIISTLFFGILYFKKLKISQKVSETPINTTQLIREQMPLSYTEAGMPLEKGIKEAPGPSQEKETLEKPPTGTEPSASNKADIAELRPLHWHFLYAEEAERRKLLDAFNSLSIIPDYKTQDLVLFNATAEKLDNLIEQIISCSKQNIPLRDFTAGIPAFKDRENRVSFYFENVKNCSSGALHWDAGLVSSQQKVKVFEAIQHMGGVIDYDLGEIVVFSIPKTKIEQLKKHIQVIGVIFTEFGNLESKEDRLASMSVKVSIYFQGM